MIFATILKNSLIIQCFYSVHNEFPNKHIVSVITTDYTHKTTFAP